MTIREKLKAASFTDEYVDIVAKEEYERILGQIKENRKKFTDTKLYKFLCTNWPEQLVQRFINRLAWRYYIKEQAKNKEISEFTGDKNNPEELWEYYLKNEIMPIETIDNKDGSFTHIYEDGLIVKVNTTLTGIVDENILIEVEKRRKRLLADYLNMDEEELINMNEEEINALVKKNEKRYKKTKKLDKRK